MTNTANKRYYWIKLKTDFFNQETIDFLLSQKNGCQYVVLYQMLCLNTANNDGMLASTVGEMLVPYDVNKIMRDTKYFDFDTVAVALELFKKLGLVYEEQDNVLKITGYEDMVGSETNSAKKIREWREKKKLQCNENVTHNVTQENRDKSIEIRDKNIDIDTDINKDINKDIENKIIDLLSSSKDIFISIKLENEYEETLKMMIRAGQITKKIPSQGRLKDLMKEMIFDRQDVSNKQGYLIECFRNEREQCETIEN